MTGPPKKRRGLCGTALRKLQLLQPHHALDLLQAPFGFVFWLIEQRKAHIDIERERRRT